MRRLLLGLGAVALTAAAAWAVVPRLATLATGATLVPPADPTVVLDREITERFGFENPVVWVLEARHGTVWTRPMLRRLAALTAEVQRIPGVIPLDVIGLPSPNMRDLRITDAGLEPTYLMGEVPEDAEAIAALRQRIDTDPNYAGTLVSRDGRAAMVVANFRRDADPRAVGTAALEVRDRHRDADTAVWVTGAPVLAVVAPTAFADVAAPAAAVGLAGLAIFSLLLGLRAATAVLLAAGATAAWVAIGAALAGATLPWALEAAVPACLVAAASAARLARPIGLGAILVAGMLAAALVAPAPADVLWLAGAAAAPLAVALGAGAHRLLAPALRPPATGRAGRLAVAAAAAVVALGIVGVRSGFSLVGYGGRYLPASAAADLASVRRLFPPPLSLAVRARGQPGFVTSPELLRAFDAATASARTDPVVRSAMSIADVVKMVNRAFNDQDPAFFAIPDDGALAGRYLALAYSPSFRRFVDRAFGTTVLWVQLDGERPADLARVAGELRAGPLARPPAGVTIDPPAGDGAVVLVMAGIARGLAASALLGLAIVVLAIAGMAGRWAGARALGGGVVAAATMAGVLGWSAFALDLVSVPLVCALAVATAALAGLAPPGQRFGLALTGAGGIALLAPLPAAPLIAALVLGPGLALGVLADD